MQFQEFKNGISQEKAKKVAKLLFDLGLKNIAETELGDYFLGVQVGLETNRRKNTGGDAFGVYVKQALEKMQTNLKKQGYKIGIEEESRIFYKNKTTFKKADFCLVYNGKQVIGIEVNFYTVSGSKPTEIKRSYGQVNQELAKVRRELVWVTDGIGYEDMKRSLKETFDIHKNTYNFKMMEENLEDDILDFLKNYKG